ncbi:MAG: cobyrinic acid a,c-diamide synthase [Parasphingorhabdus sp.]
MQSRFYISAAHKSSGKTTVSIGLAAALKRRGESVQCFKKGPDYIDPMWLAHASAKPCFNLDFNVQSNDEIRQTLSRASDANVALIEGSKGLYDGTELDGSNSNAAMARLLIAPVVLVIDCRGITRGIAPLLQGYAGFESVDFAGVILNMVGGSRHESKLRKAIEHYTSFKVLGAVPFDPLMEIKERHLGLMPSNEHHERDRVRDDICQHVEKNVDLDLLLSETGRPSPVELREPTVEKTAIGSLTIAIARDEAFGFYYADDLDQFEKLGAKLRFFSPIHDTKLPDADALFIGGGFPESFAKELSQNTAMLQQVRRFCQLDKPMYAECGGLMYLSRSITTNAGSYEQAGVLDLDVTMKDKPCGRGYVRVCPTGRHPWPAEPDEIRAHEFHYSYARAFAPDSQFAYKVERGHGFDGKHDGLVVGNILANYLHQRHTASNPWVSRFLNFVQQSGSGEKDVN